MGFYVVVRSLPTSRVVNANRAHSNFPAVSVLLVVAHPDDEVLGAGATTAALTAAGIAVTACILSGSAEARRHRPDVAQLRADAEEASAMLGAAKPIFGEFPNLAFNTVPHGQLVAFIENAMVQCGASTLFTHHPNDLNDDHRQTSHACQAAARLFQRRDDVPALRALHYMEVLSSTDWVFGGPFSPTTFSGIGGELLDMKIAALAVYRGVMRPSPHPRSEATIRALAVYRGSQCGRAYAEGFVTAFRSGMSDELA